MSGVTGAVLMGAPQGPFSIVIQSRVGRDIQNLQISQFSPFERSQRRRLREQYPKAVFRTPAIPIYNCHGLVFASSRSTLDDGEVRGILADDGYGEVDEKDAMPGDVLIYFGSAGNAEHSAIVIETPGELKIPLVWSKWGKFAEAIHQANHCPYDFSGAKYFRIMK